MPLHAILDVLVESAFNHEKKKFFDLCPDGVCVCARYLTSLLEFDWDLFVSNALALSSSSSSSFATLR